MVTLNYSLVYLIRPVVQEQCSNESRVKLFCLVVVGGQTTDAFLLNCGLERRSKTKFSGKDDLVGHLASPDWIWYSPSTGDLKRDNSNKVGKS